MTAVAVVAIGWLAGFVTGWVARDSGQRKEQREAQSALLRGILETANETVREEQTRTQHTILDWAWGRDEERELSA
jgi:hypothetical protein